MAKFTIRQYEDIAIVLFSTRPLTGPKDAERMLWNTIVERMTERLQSLNPKFKPHLFHKSCGYTTDSNL
jgi:hypothetical protein